MKKLCLVFCVFGFILSATCGWADLPADLANALGVPKSDVLIKSGTVDNTTITNNFLVNIDNTYNTKYDDTYHIALAMSYLTSRPVTVPIQLNWNPKKYDIPFVPSRFKVQAFITVDGIPQQPELIKHLPSSSETVNMSFDASEIMWTGNVNLIVQLYRSGSIISFRPYIVPQSGLTIEL